MTKVTSISGSHGKTLLGDLLLENARLLAAQDFAEAEAEAFAGDAVRDHSFPSWLGDLSLIFPTFVLNKLGLQAQLDRAHLYATCGVESHTDHIDGPSVAVVLHSDGFTFKQQKTRLPLQAGDWFIFNDNLPHEVRESKKSTTLLVLTAPIR